MSQGRQAYKHQYAKRGGLKMFIRFRTETFIIVACALAAALFFPMKSYIGGDLQDTVVVSERTVVPAGTDIPLRIIVRHRK